MSGVVTMPVDITIEQAMNHAAMWLTTAPGVDDLTVRAGMVDLANSWINYAATLVQADIT
jgi:hypothetical protein